jgi:hypothetical protein
MAVLMEERGDNLVGKLDNKSTLENLGMGGRILLKLVLINSTII